MKDPASFQDQLAKVHSQMMRLAKPVNIDVNHNENMTTSQNSGNSSVEDDIVQGSSGEQPPVVDTTTELRPAGPSEPYFERTDSQGRPRRYLERRRDRVQQPQFHGHVEVTVGNDRTQIPLTADERHQFIATTQKIHTQTAKNTAMAFWAQLANTAIGLIGAIGLGYAMYRGIRHDVTKDTKLR